MPIQLSPKLGPRQQTMRARRNNLVSVTSWVGQRLVVASMILLILPPTAIATQVDPSYVSDISPILAENCVGCHSIKNKMGGLRLDTYEGLIEGGKRGPSLVAGMKMESPIYLMVTGEMEPKMPFSAEPLKQVEIDLLGRWIEIGAPGPKGNELATKTEQKRLPKIAPTLELKSQIFSLSYHPEGHLLAIGRHGGVNLIDTTTGHLIAQFDGLSDIARAVAFSPDGKLVAIGGGYAQQSGDVRIWDITKRREILQIAAHTDTIQSLAFSPDQKILATASYDKDIRLWNTTSGEELQTLRDHIDAVYSLAFTGDGNRLISGSADRSIKIWDPHSGERLYTLSEPIDGINSIAVHPSGKQVSAGGHDRTIRVWELEKENGKISKTLIAHQSAILHIAYSPDGKKIATTAADRTIKIFDAKTLDELVTLNNQSDWVMALSFSPDGEHLAVGRFDGSLSIYDSEDYLDTFQTVGIARKSP